MSRPNALIVDSSTFVRGFIKKVLVEELKFDKTRDTSDHGEAMRMLEADRSINWVFGEWDGPALPAREYLEKMRKSAAGKQAKFVMMSSGDENSARALAIREGAQDYLCKPFSQQQLSRKIQRLAGLEERRQAERVRLDTTCEIDIGFDAFQTYGGDLLDISATGCLVRTSQLQQGYGRIDDIGTVKLLPGGKNPLNIDVKVRRLQYDKNSTDPLSNTQIGLEFYDMGATVNAKLAAFIESCKKTR
ncbi:MAG: PilZ domain-containing protein [Sulfuricella sp.]|nr:PilZ domain-containing protein [Sulfuricella sp.]